MSGGIWTLPAGADIALAAGVAKTVLGVRAGAAFAIYLKRLRISFDGVNAANTPVLIELCRSTFATQPPTGTNNTVVTPVLHTGRSTTVGVTAARNWTTEPTALTPIEEFRLTPNGGTLAYDEPLQDEPDCDLQEGFVVRLTAVQNVNARPVLLFGRC
ncbi:hypothetical protein [Cryptosporangium sp. NPDC051539]|uniref:hypothetical protein n=1 Tax=Cryptosporangium sp. NPDC051539 TaxID=3363962 RepID=UPI00379D6D6D